MSENNLKGKDKRALRSIGQTLKPTLIIGKAGLNENSIKTLNQAFSKNDLIKVRLSEGTGKARKLAAQEIAEQIGAEIVGITGKSILLYKQNDSEEL